ncbi:hypothetical protein FEP49_02623 [Burkholderia multivorans]|nr:hypothetical protein [Burkholderia multivorans]
MGDAARRRCARCGRRRIVGVRAGRDPVSGRRSRIAVAVAGRRGCGRRPGVRSRAAALRRRRLHDRRAGPSHGRLDRSRYGVRELGSRRRAFDRSRLSVRRAALGARHAARKGAGRVSRRTGRHQRRCVVRSDRRSSRRVAQRRLLRRAYLPADRGGRVGALRRADARRGRLLGRLARAGAAARLGLRRRASCGRVVARDPRARVPRRFARVHDAVRAAAVDVRLHVDAYAPHADRELARRRAQPHAAMGAAAVGRRYVDLGCVAARLAG